MKKSKYLFMVVASLLLIPTSVVLGDSSVGSTDWGGYRKTQKYYTSTLEEHSTDVHCKDDSGHYQAGSRTYVIGMDDIPYQKTTTTKWTYGWLRIPYGRDHIHDYYGGTINK